jgi:hypothetical protein
LAAVLQKNGVLLSPHPLQNDAPVQALGGVHGRLKFGVGQWGQQGLGLLQLVQSFFLQRPV